MKRLLRDSMLPLKALLPALSIALLPALWIGLPGPLAAAEPEVDFNRDIRPILSNRCFTCHGPDDGQREADLRLDAFAEATADRDGSPAIVPGSLEKSVLWARITSEDEDERMPPAGTGKPLTPQQLELFSRWIRQGAPYDRHWSYTAPRRPALPTLPAGLNARTALDTFVLAKLDQLGMQPSPEADRYSLIRRLSQDLRGLPPRLDEVDRFVADTSPDAYEQLVDRFLQDPAFGERWGAVWLDLARYADSAGYANDPPRTIWLYRDWVIRSLNANLPFDQFTRLQIAGDLLPELSPQQLAATAFHRNTVTNSEGGTNDEEFRTVAVVDRVNTTMQVWMGTTIRCAQCHNHKYDPISQEEYFRFYAFFNHSEDADRADEQPVATIETPLQAWQRERLQNRIAGLKKQLEPSDEQLRAAIPKLEQNWARRPQWQTLQPEQAVAQSGSSLAIRDDGSVLAGGTAADKDDYTIEFTLPAGSLRGLRVETLPDPTLPDSGPGRGKEGAFVLSELRLEAGPSGKGPQPPRTARYVRVDLAGKGKMIHLAEVEVFSGGRNVARQGKATQSSTDYAGPPERAIDGNTSGVYTENSVTHTAVQEDPWWEVDLGKAQPIDRVLVWNRTDANLQSRLDGFVLSLLDEQREVVWTQQYAKAPQRDLTADVSGFTTLALANASATFAAPSLPAEKNPYPTWQAAAAVDQDAKGSQWGWSNRGAKGQAQTAVFALRKPYASKEPTRLRLRLQQQAGGAQLLGRVRVSWTDSTEPLQVLPHEVQAILKVEASQRSAQQQTRLLDYLRKVTPPDPKLVQQISALEKQQAAIKPASVPVMRELPADKRRTTKIQIRGNFLVTGKEVDEGVPAAFHAFRTEWPRNRLGVAEWLVDRNNPLTARVVVNRHWEQLFGRGLVVTSEEFGNQGELPTHPKLLDWLAVDFMEQGWDLKALLRTIVNSATYRQTSRMTEASIAQDPDNRWLSRGPRFRLSAEMIRDQALAVSGLLSREMHGPSVRPPRPNLGLKAAFGGSTDWATSPGQDKHRRGLYTTWRRSLPYPSMAAFDAPSRVVCTIRRIRTNTPLQALVTLNDPVYIEAAQALARRMLAEGGAEAASRARWGGRLCLSRPLTDVETARLVGLFGELKDRFADDPAAAKEMATEPIGPPPAGTDLSELAAWTVVANVLLNLDETLSRK